MLAATGDILSNLQFTHNKDGDRNDNRAASCARFVLSVTVLKVKNLKMRK